MYRSIIEILLGVDNLSIATSDRAYRALAKEDVRPGIAKSAFLTYSLAGTSIAVEHEITTFLAVPLPILRAF